MNLIAMMKRSVWLCAAAVLVAAAAWAVSAPGVAHAADLRNDAPASSLTVQVFVNGYDGLVVYEKEYAPSELQKMATGRTPVKFCGYRGGKFPAGRVATEYVPFAELFADAGVRFGSGDSLVMGSSEGATKISYDDYFATPRYYYPHFYDSANDCFTDESGAVEVAPCLILKSYGIPHPEDKANSGESLSLDEQLDEAASGGLCDYKYAYMMGFGQRSIGDMEEDTYSAMGWSRQSKVAQVTYPTLEAALEKLAFTYGDDRPAAQGLSTLLEKLVEEAEADDASTQVGKNPQSIYKGTTFVTPEVKSAFEASISRAKDVLADGDVSSSSFVSACRDLAGARDAFDASRQEGALSNAFRFADVKAEIAEFGAAGVWYVADGWLDYVVTNGVMSGYAGSADFGPYDALTRGQAAAILYRAFTGATASTTDNGVDAGFPDVAPGSYCAAAVRWCAERGIVTGYEGGEWAGTFRPDAPVSREELATMVARYACYAETSQAGVLPADEGALSRFADAGEVDGYARAAMAWCCENGVVGGVGGTSLAPHDGAWRASMAKMIAVVTRDVLKA